MINKLNNDLRTLGYVMWKTNPLTYFDESNKVEISIDVGCISKWNSCACETVPFTCDELFAIAEHIKENENEK